MRWDCRLPNGPHTDLHRECLQRCSEASHLHKAIAASLCILPAKSRQNSLKTGIDSFDTTRAATNLVLSGTLERYPDVELILSHAGGAVPYIAGRIALADDNPLVAKNVPRGAIASLERLYYDTALSATRHTFPCLKELVPATQILFGSDYPFAPQRLTAETIGGLAEHGGFDAGERAAIERDNAMRLFPRLGEAAQ